MKTTSKGTIRYEEGSDNVFADLGVRDPEGSLVRAKLARQIADLIKARRLSQGEIAAILKVDQPKVSKLVRGRISGFTSDRLLRFLTVLGCDVHIRVKPRRSARGALVRGKVVVSAVGKGRRLA
ncbi:MAG TPA: helix-turn-helix transcriptional regulator [Candidatus Acidoferrales bacterium]|nr:helix-turn-helix transcriptional regulator [Candidatus Acidoferrales bacterium]